MYIFFSCLLGSYIYYILVLMLKSWLSGQVWVERRVHNLLIVLVRCSPYLHLWFFEVLGIEGSKYPQKFHLMKNGVWFPPWKEEYCKKIRYYDVDQLRHLYLYRTITSFLVSFIAKNVVLFEWRIYENMGVYLKLNGVYMWIWEFLIVCLMLSLITFRVDYIFVLPGANVGCFCCWMD